MGDRQAVGVSQQVIGSFMHLVNRLQRERESFKVQLIIFTLNVYDSDCTCPEGGAVERGRALGVGVGLWPTLCCLVDDSCRSCRREED